MLHLSHNYFPGVAEMISSDSRERNMHLVAAAALGSIQKSGIDYLLSLGCDPNFVEGEIILPPLFVVSNGEKAKALIDGGADPMCRITEKFVSPGRTPAFSVSPFETAAVACNVDTCKFLLPWTFTHELTLVRHKIKDESELRVFCVLKVHERRDEIIKIIDTEIAYREQWIHPLNSLQSLAAQTIVRDFKDWGCLADWGYPPHIIDFLLFTQIAMDRGYNTTVHDRLRASFLQKKRGRY